LLSAFLISLREGVELLSSLASYSFYLSPNRRSQLARFVWSGVAVAGALSLAVAIALERWQINQTALKACCFAGAVFVISMIIG